MKYKLVPMYHPAAGMYDARVRKLTTEDFKHFPHAVPSSVETQCTIQRADEAVAHVGVVVGIDTETDPKSGRLQCVATSGEEGRAFVSDIPHVFHEDVQWALHNAKFDLPILERHSMEIPQGTYVDTMIAASALNYGQVGLHRLARQVLGMELRHWNEAENLTDLMHICGSHADATRRLWMEFKDKLPPFYWDIDLPLVEVLMRMEQRGVRIDKEALLQRQRDLQEEIATFSFPFNPNSPKQVGEYLFGFLGLPTGKTTDGGAYSTDVSVLEGLDHAVPQSLLRYRQLSKELGTYIDSYVERMDDMGYLHPDFIQIRQPSRDQSKEEGARTGRLACARPNLQNPLKRKGRSIRSLFVASEGNLLVATDYSQIELRVMAVMSGDEGMLEVFRQGGDIHQETADATGLPRKKEDNDTGRGGAKELNFLMCYGGSEYKIREEWGWSLEDGRAVIEAYFKKYPKVKAYIKAQQEQARETKMVRTWFGRERVLDELYSDDPKVYAAGLREAINSPIQGTAADVVKTGMVKLGARVPMVLQVHDEMVMDVPRGEAREFAKYLTEVLPCAIVIDGMEFPVDVEVGENWQELLPMEVNQ